MDGEDELLHDAISGLLTSASKSGTAISEQTGLRDYPLHIVPAMQSCRRIIYTTKMDWLIALADGLENVPQDVAIVGRSAPLGGPHRVLIRAVVQSLGAPLYFVGDLDPLDLVTYATLVASDEAPLATAHYLGVSESWLERCEQDLASQCARSIDRVSIRMGADERAGFDRLKEIPLDRDRLVGPRALSMLGSGLKLELEGASNPHFYSNRFRDELLRLLFQ